MCAAVSNPSQPGICRSIRMTSNCDLEAASSASKPSSAHCTSKDCLRSAWLAMVWATLLSSITSTRPRASWTRPSNAVPNSPEHAAATGGEDAAAAEFTSDLDGSVEQLHQLPGNRQTQAQAAVASRQPGLELPKALEDIVELLRRDSGAGVGNFHGQRDQSRVGGSALKRELPPDLPW